MRYLRFYFEILFSLFLISVVTLIAYGQLVGWENFWDAQTIWNYILMACWLIVSAGYFHQGWMIHMDHSAAHVSIALPIAVFLAQCVLFVKGVYFHDWSLIFGAILVNSGVLYSVYQMARRKLSL